MEFVASGDNPADRSLRRSLRQAWFVRYAPPTSHSTGKGADAQTRGPAPLQAAAQDDWKGALGFDAPADSVREARRLIFQNDDTAEAAVQGGAPQVQGE